MAVEVRLPNMLRPAAGGQRTVPATGGTVGEVFEDIVRQHPGLRPSLLTAEGDLHRHLNVFVNDDDVRYLGKLGAKVTDKDTITLMPAVAGAVPDVALYDSVLDTIGNTPLVDISELSPNPRARLLIKLEGLNPAGSVKDRAAKSMVEEAEKNGSLRPGQRMPRVLLGQYGCRSCHDRQGQGLPLQRGRAGERLCRAVQAAEGVRGRDHLVAGGPRFQRGHAARTGAR